MKATELLQMGDEQLNQTLADTEKSLFQLRFQAATDRLESPTNITKARRDIARIKTEQHKRELGKLRATPVDAMPVIIAELHAKTEGKGKRRVKRQIARLEELRAGAVDTVQAPGSTVQTTITPAKGK